MDSFSGKVIVDFFATWCEPCVAISAALEEIQDELDIAVIGINVDEFRDLAIEYGVQNIPTLILFDNRLEVARMEGAGTKEEIISQLSM